MAYQVQISAKILSWPRSCACCLKQADNELRASASRTTGKRVQRTTTSWWEVPYCSACLSHQARYKGAASIFAGSAVLGLVLWIIVGLAASGGAGAILAFTSFLVGLFLFIAAKQGAEKSMSKTCCSPGSAVKYVEWHGTFHTFVFESETYLHAFLAANDRKTRSDVREV